MGLTRRRVWVLIAAGAALVALLLWTLAPTAEQPYLDYVASLRTAGEPVTAEDFWGPDPREDENAAVAIASAVSSLHAEFGPTQDWPLGSGAPLAPADRLSPEQRAVTTEFVGRLAPFCARVDQALSRPRCRFVSVRAASANVEMKATEPLWDTVSALLAVARFSPDPAVRVEASCALLRVAHHTEAMTWSDFDLAVDLVRETVSAVRSDSESSGVLVAQRRAALDSLLAEPWDGGWARLVAAERPYHIQERLRYFDDLAGLGLIDRIRFRLGRVNMRRDVRMRQQNEMTAEEAIELAEFWPRAAALPKSSYLEQGAAWRALSRASAAQVPDVPTRFAHSIAVESCRRLARVALAAAEHRATHGDFPASLDELAPMFPDGVPLDPFTDAPFVYERTATGVRIASQGRLDEEPAVDDAELRDRGMLWELKR